MTCPVTMRAAVYRPGNLNLIIENDFPISKPGKGQVLLKVAACGACHSDTFLLSNAVIDDRSYILGHEIAGYAVEFGEGVEGIKEGRLYAVFVLTPCACRTLGPPPIDDSTGIGLNGGFAEFVTVSQSQLVPVPHGLAPEVACVAGDSLITAYNAIHNVAGLRPGSDKRVLIYGVGGLGHQALQIAKHYGATVFAVDYKRAARELALRLGAERALTLSELMSETAAGTFTVDVVVDFVANGQCESPGNALNIANPPSKIVLVGVSTEELPTQSAQLIEFNTQVLPTLYGSLDDLKSSLRLLSEGVVKPVVHIAPLERVGTAMNDLRASAVYGRRIIVPTLQEY
ncbi:GroES-like protein [Trametes meyenii]|nr:GroES-like protein [Trametes meyenii]